MFCVLEYTGFTHIGHVITVASHYLSLVESGNGAYGGFEHFESYLISIYLLQLGQAKL